MHFFEYWITEGLAHFNRGGASLRKLCGFVLPTAPFESRFDQVLFLSVFLSGVQHTIQGFNDHVYSYDSNGYIGINLLMQECQTGAVFHKEGVIGSNFCGVKQGIVIK